MVRSSWSLGPCVPESVKTDYDSPWKDILETYFQPALELCFPQIARQINWSKGVQLLSKEFQKIVRRSELGRRSVDVSGSGVVRGGP